MFSPYYAWSGRRDPENHCAVNVALYGRRNLWAMTERGRASLRRTADDIAVGRSRAALRDGVLDIEIDERTAPIPQPLRGRIVVRAPALLAETYALDGAGRHFWRPIAPDATLEVSFSKPALGWRGRAYIDANWGDEPLDDAFSSWHWSRAHVGAGAAVHYDVVTRGGEKRSLSLRFGLDGARPIDAPPPALALTPTGWRIPRHVRGGDAPAELVATLEDAPFYARSRLRAQIDGAPADIFHESLSLDRLRSPLVRAMLPFRMPRFG